MYALSQRGQVQTAPPRALQRMGRGQQGCLIIRARYGGLSIARIEESADGADTVVILTGWLIDQAALNGVLNALYADQCSILAVSYLGPREEPA